MKRDEAMVEALKTVLEYLYDIGEDAPDSASWQKRALRLAYIVEQALGPVEERAPDGYVVQWYDERARRERLWLDTELQAEQMADHKRRHGFKAVTIHRVYLGPAPRADASPK